MRRYMDELPGGPSIGRSVVNADGQIVGITHTAFVWLVIRFGTTKENVKGEDIVRSSWRHEEVGRNDLPLGFDPGVTKWEKGLAGAGGGGGDSGVTQRVFGTIISWMQERKRPVFMFATANDVTGLPSELLRKGRFDDIFAIDLPTTSEREEIFGIHLMKRSRNPEDFDVAALALASKDFTGAEIEESVIAAMYRAFDEGREVETTDVGDAIGITVPLAVTAREQIERLRNWARERARPASKVEEKKSKIKLGARRLSS